MTHTALPEYKLSKFDRVATSPIKGKFLCFGVVLLAFLVAMIVMSPFMAIGQMIPAVLNQPIADLLNG